MKLRGHNAWSLLPFLGLSAYAAGWGALPQAPYTVALYQFDEGSGTSTSNSMGNGHGGTLSGILTLPLWVDGQSGHAVDFAPDGSVVTLADPVTLGSTW